MSFDQQVKTVYLHYGLLNFEFLKLNILIGSIN